MIFSILTFIAICLSLLIKDRTKSLHVYSISCICESLYCITVGALTGTFLGIINFIRTYLFSCREIFSKKAYFSLFLFFEFVVFLNFIITYDGTISLLPTMASIIGIYCLWVPHTKYLKFSSLIKGMFYAVYYAYYGGWFLVWGYTVVFLFSFYILIKDERKKSFLQIIKLRR